MVYEGCMVQTLSSQATSLTTNPSTMSSSSNSSPSHPGHLNNQHFHRVFPTALPRHQRNILYAAVLQQPSLVMDLERQSSYEEDDSIHSLVCIFHHLCSTQIYVGSLEPHTDHVTSSTLHMATAVTFSFPSLPSHPCCSLKTPAGPPSLSSLDSPHPWDTLSSLSLHSSPNSPKHRTP